MKHVFFTSEKPLKRHYEAAEHAFGVRPFVRHGQAERVALAQQHAASDVLHVIPEYSHVELLRLDGSRIDTPGETGMIVGQGTCWCGLTCPSEVVGTL